MVVPGDDVKLCVCNLQGFDMLVDIEPAAAVEDADLSV